MQILKKILIFSIHLIMYNGYAAEFTFRDFLKTLKIPVYDSENNIHSAYEILTGDVAFKTYEEAIKAGFKFSPDNTFSINEIVLVPISGEGYSYGLITNSNHGRPPYSINLGMVFRNEFYPGRLGKGKIILKPDDEKTKMNKELFKAAAFGDVKAVDELSAKGADPNFIFYKPKLFTPLIMAAHGDSVEILNKLLERAKDIESKNEKGQTLFMLAIILEKTPIALELLKKGAEISVEDIYGNTPLHWAAFKGLNEVAKALIDRKVDIDKQNKFGSTPLLFTVEGEKEKPDIAFLLLSHGANPCLKNKEGQSFVRKIQKRESMQLIWNKYENERIIKILQNILNRNEINPDVIKNIIDNMSTIQILSKMPKQYWEALFGTYEISKDIIENIINEINAEIKKLNCK